MGIEDQIPPPFPCLPCLPAGRLYKREGFPLFGKEGVSACAKPLSPAKELVRRAGRRRQGEGF